MENDLNIAREQDRMSFTFQDKQSLLGVKFTSKAFDKVPASCGVITTFQDERPLKGNASLLDWRLNGRLSKIMMKHRFEGKFGEVLLMPSEGRIFAKNILIVGLGEKRNFNEHIFNKFIHLILDTLEKSRVEDFMVSFFDLIPDHFEWRNSVRLLVSKLHGYQYVQTAFLCEPDICVRDAKKRHMDFGMNVNVSFETTQA